MTIEDIEIYPCYLYDVHREKAQEIDAQYGEEMDEGPYFAHHEGNFFLIDVEDMTGEVRERIEHSFCDTVESGLSMIINNVEEYHMARQFLRNPNFRSCIISYGTEQKLLIEPTTMFLMQSVIDAL